ncbi:hypothetical protein C0989_005691 [Termitomyces sp. Mn162]|nr:hypothetical protein C0989_005691 [Termitomyces sp. Mn162]
MLAFKLDLLAHHFDMLSLSLVKTYTEPNGQPKPKRLKFSQPIVYPSFLSFHSSELLFPANFKPGSKAVLLLLSQVNAALEAIQLADNRTLLPHTNLQKHCNAIHLSMQQQLYSLDITLQTYKLILACLDHLNKTLGPSDIDQTGDLLNNLQVSY